MRNMTRLGAGVAAMALVAAACAEDDGNDEIEEGALAGASFTVGSKEFPEQEILGYIAILALQHADAEVQDETGISGSAPTRRALEAGEIDMYWEYTGTGWTDILGNETADAASDADELFAAVAEQDGQENQVAWIAKSTANDTYAFATSQETSDETGVTTLSDYAELANSDPASATVCAAAEFLDRQDGGPGMEQAYGFELPDRYITEVDLGLVFEGVPKGDPCRFGEVFETDGRIPANDLVVLEDDKDYFVSYEVAMTVNQSVLDESPELEEVLQPVADALTTEELTMLNSQVDVEGLPVEAVAERWLQEKELIG
jgi:osmoprotectant transport system substrate-binding protein